MNLKVKIPGLAYLMLAISYFIIIINPLGWHMFLHVSPLYLALILVTFADGKVFIQKEDRIYVFTMLLFTVFTVFSLFFISDQYGALGKTIRHVIEFLCLTFFLNCCKNKNGISYLVKAYIYSAIAVIIKMLLQRYSFIDDPNRYSIVNWGNVMDPNFLAAMFVFPSIVVFYRGLWNDFRKKDIVEIAIMLLAIVMLGSRGGLFGVGLGYIILWLFQKKRKKTVIVGIILAIIGLSVLMILVPDTMSRFDVRSFNDGSNSLRFNLWDTSWRIFLSSPLYGRGGNSMLVLGPSYGARINLMSHNSFLDILADYGLIGFTLFYIGPVVLIIRSIKVKDILVLAIMVGSIGTAMFISGSDSAFWWQNYMLCIAMYNKKIGMEYE